MSAKIRIGALISGGGSNLRAIMEACDSGVIDGAIAFVGSDNSQAGGLQRAAEKGVPTFVVDYAAILKEARQGRRKPPDDFGLKQTLVAQRLVGKACDPKKQEEFFASRAAAEAAMLEAMAAFSFDLLVLAGFMRILTPYFIDRVNLDAALPRIMNIHPALLPSFPGVDGYGDTFRYGCKVAGCTVHFIDYGEDTGPIIGQRAFQITPQDTEASVRSKGLEQEWKLYPACIQLFARKRLRVVHKKYPMKNGTVQERRIVEILPNKD